MDLKMGIINLVREEEGGGESNGKKKEKKKNGSWTLKEINEKN